MSESVLAHSLLENRLVLSRQTSEKIGHLSQLLVDPPSQVVVGFYCGGGLLSSRQPFRWEQVESVGSDSMLVTGEEWDVDLKGTSPVRAPIGHELWTDGGNQMGKITDVFFDPNTGAIARYLFTSKGWHGVVDGTYQLPPIAVSSIGSKRVLVLETMLSHVQLHAEGLGQKAEHVVEFLKADYDQTKEDLAALKQTTQSAVQKVKDILPHPSSEEPSR